MAELIPPDEIYIPWEVAIDFDIFARDGVITKEIKYLLATPEREATSELFKAVRTFFDAYDRSHQFEKTDVARIMIRKALALADDKDGG